MKEENMLCQRHVLVGQENYAIDIDDLTGAIALCQLYYVIVRNQAPAQTLSISLIA